MRWLRILVVPLRSLVGHLDLGIARVKWKNKNSKVENGSRDIISLTLHDYCTFNSSRSGSNISDVPSDKETTRAPFPVITLANISTHRDIINRFPAPFMTHPLREAYETSRVVPSLIPNSNLSYTSRRMTFQFIYPSSRLNFRGLFHAK